MTEAEFRKIALSLPETIEKSHVGHPDFRVRLAGPTLRREVVRSPRRRNRPGKPAARARSKPKVGKIFATLGYPRQGFGVLVLTPEQQGELIGRYPEMFEPVKGGWGKRGSTLVQLKAARPDVIKLAMKLAWQNAVPMKKREI